MNVRKNLPLVVSASVALVLIVIALVAVIRFKTDYSRVDRELQNGLQRLNSLNQQNPYPSEENVTLAENRLGAIQGYYSDLLTGLREGQIEPEAIEPAEFPPLLEKTVRALRKAAADADVMLPAKFSFGFDRYLKGQFPRAEDIPRLVVELKAIERFGYALFDARVEEVIDISREVFESTDESGGEQVTRRGGRRAVAQPQPVPTPSGSAGVVDHELYSAEEITIEFEARESAVWDVLNRLARSDVFVIVRSVELKGKKLDLQPPEEDKSAGGPAGNRGAKPKKRDFRSSAEAFEERVVAGTETVTVTIKLSMYRFKAVS